eukprot:TRINITY_DN2798_c0_g2_i2.p1 TRINITY_DN2798_c0_g2~~TRINITY_DN2798_c0_g2_i2.p1  ORF type:complete len:405 (+),score=63.46 TRINITY_DN2798_c0_g2_i2:54-1217(+)
MARSRSSLWAATLACILVVVLHCSTAATSYVVPIRTTVSSSSSSFVRNHTAIVTVFESILNSNHTLRSQINASIVDSVIHGPTSAAPWNVEDLYKNFDSYLTYIPVSSSTFRYFYELGDILLAPVWQDPVVVSWLKDFVSERGAFLYSPQTAGVVTQWMTDPRVNNSDYEIPAKGYTSWGEWFTRDLVPGARPVVQPDVSGVAVSPVDAVIAQTFSNIGAADKINVKSNWFVNTTALLGSKELGERFEGGDGILFILSPYNYHHFHAPVNVSSVASVSLIGGSLFGLNTEESMVGFHRAVMIYEGLDGIGDVAMIPTGVVEVGSVVPYVQEGDSVDKGDLVGTFDLGGSSCVVLFEPGVLVGWTALVNDTIAVGQAFAKLNATSART